MQWLRWVDRQGRLIPTGVVAQAEANRRAAEAEQAATEAHR